MEQPHQIRQIVEELKTSFQDLQAIYLYGSRATDNLNSQSDWDLALMIQKPTDPKFVFEAGQRLARVLKSDVDLVDLRSANTVLRKQIITTGKILFRIPSSKVEHFEFETLSQYVYLNEERKEIIKSIKNTGRIYG